MEFEKTWIESEGRPYVIVQGYFIEGGKRKQLTYYVNKTNPSEWGTEYYSGPNYVPPFDSFEKSYSRNYSQWKGLPIKYAEMAQFLKSLLAEQLKSLLGEQKP